MRMVIQRVKHASVTVDGEITGKIGQGFLVLLGIGPDDNEQIMEKMADKMMRLRIFSDENDKINLSLQDVGGELLLVSQFTLYADCRKGNRPSFVQAAPPAQAEALYEACKAYCKKIVPVVESGIFGADMQVELCNDGPFTVVLDSEELGLHSR
ncbi:D-aminoacyl-tRNA deacylase [Ruminococcus sp.]|uniref:D-aminoacyl-tRNA deacylase n=1 Tax=Ruminococcus sp. TaxID=41978 RepID=UPI0025EFB86F|nr:D-aminoacyl-tRNA deacylase [Ruminococcus sp.]